MDRSTGQAERRRGPAFLFSDFSVKSWSHFGDLKRLMNRVVARWWDPGEFCVPFALFCGFQMFPHKEALGLWWGWRPSSSGVAGERHVSPGRRP